MPDSNLALRDQHKFSDEASELVMQCGIAPCLLGFSYIAQAVVIYAFGERKLTNIYRQLAVDNSVKVKSVMRDISYAIDQTKNIHNNLSGLVGIHIPQSEIRSGLVIAHLGLILYKSVRDSKL